MSQAQYAIIADDFTGANDAGLQLRKSGANVGVVLDRNRLGEMVCQLDAVVIDTESRSVAPEYAFECVRQSAERLCQGDLQQLYKKLDSTMRGNIGAEIDGALAGAYLDLALVAPALPAWGRTTRDGICYVHGVPVAETEAARDPQAPVSSSSIPAIIGGQSTRKVGRVGLADVRKGKAAILQAIEVACQAGSEVIVCDAVEEADLAELGRAVVELPGRALLAGSTGWAAHIASFAGDTGSPMDCDGPLVFIVGSVSEVTQGQVDYAAGQGVVAVLDLDTSAVKEKREEAERAQLIGEATQLIEQGRNVVIRSQRFGLDSAREGGISDTIARFLSETTRDLCRAAAIGGLVLTGGDTAIAVARAMDVGGTIIEDEVLPGVPCCRFIGKVFGDRPVVTKAGGFGDVDAFVRILDYFERP